MILAASQIHDGYRFLTPGAAIELGEDGTVLNVFEHYSGADAVHHDGVLCPGFVNAHCHLELSHMRGLIPEGTGLMAFLQGVISKRGGFTAEEIKTARHAAYNELLRNGVVAVGDISNTSDTLDIRAMDALHIHTFVECIGFTDTAAQPRFDFSKKVYDAFAQQKPGDKILRQSIVPHAPYSVSKSVFELIDAHEPESLISIHNQECSDEDEWYQTGTGEVAALLQTLGVDHSFFQASGCSSLQTYGQWLSPSHTLLLIHNTRTSRADIHFAKKRFPNLYFCLCPNANLYIEQRLPDINLLMEEGANICIGTDSLSSNHALSPLAELETIQKHFPQIGWEILRRLVLMVRETPFHLGHLRAMMAVTEMGAIVAPPIPGFYKKPQSVLDIVDHSVERVMDLLGVPAADAKRWSGPEVQS